MSILVPISHTIELTNAATVFPLSDAASQIDASLEYSQASTF